MVRQAVAALVFAAAAVGCWPVFDGPAVRLGGTNSDRLPGSRSRVPAGAVAVGVPVAVWALLGPLPAVASIVAVLTCCRLVWLAGRDRAAMRALGALQEAVGEVARDLRAGMPTEAAFASAGGDRSPPVTSALLAAAAAVTGRSVIAAPGARPPAVAESAAGTRRDRAVASRLAPAAERLITAAGVAGRRGVPLASLLAAVEDDLAADLAVRSRVAGEAAGPRLSGYLLTGLPLFGLLVGQGMGGHPLRVLLGPAPGGLLLPAGTILIAAGLLWSDRIGRGP